MTALALIIPGTRTATPVSADLAGPAVEFGGGKNIVNVILVDVRAWDTYGEVTVLIAAATGVASLIFLVRRTGRDPPATDSGDQDPVRPRQPSPWLATNWMPRRSLLLEVVTRMIFHIIVVFSVYVLFVGHDEPGGGFAAGLIVGLALALRYIAGGAYELGEAAPVDPGILMGVGLFISSATAVYGVVAGGAALQSTILKATVPVLGDLKFVTSSIFDIGVYLIVIGLVLDVLRSMGAELDRQGVLDRFELRDPGQPGGAPRSAGEPMTTNLVLALTIGGLFACGVYLMLSRNLVRVILGFLLAGHGVNLMLLSVGRRVRTADRRGARERRGGRRPDPAGADPDLDRDQPGGVDVPAGHGLPQLHADQGAGAGRRARNPTKSPTPNGGG